MEVPVGDLGGSVSGLLVFPGDAEQAGADEEGGADAARARAVAAELVSSERGAFQRSGGRAE